MINIKPNKFIILDKFKQSKRRWDEVWSGHIDGRDAATLSALASLAYLAGSKLAQESGYTLIEIDKLNKLANKEL